MTWPVAHHALQLADLLLQPLDLLRVIQVRLFRSRRLQAHAGSAQGDSGREALFPCIIGRNTDDASLERHVGKGVAW